MTKIFENLTYTEGERGLLHPNIDLHVEDVPEEMKQPLGYIGRMILVKMEEENLNQAFQVKTDVEFFYYAKKKELEAQEKIRNLADKILDKNPPSETDMLQRIRDFNMAHQQAKEIILHEYQ